MYIILAPDALKCYENHWTVEWEQTFTLPHPLLLINNIKYLPAEK